MLFVTGAPRSGTTFVSDWITQAEDAYCAHEISREVEGMTDSEILDYLWYCARTGADRQSKRALHEFVRWPAHQPKTQLTVLGFKEPIFWPVQSGVAPYHVDSFLERFPTKYVFMLRHPYDVIASGRWRAEQTTTWPGFTTDEHARLWISSFQLWQWHRERGHPIFTIRWERLLLEYSTVRDELQDFLGLGLPVFHGYELSEGQLKQLRQRVSLADGVVGNPDRERLTDKDLHVICSVVGNLANHLGYNMEP